MTLAATVWEIHGDQKTVVQILLHFLMAGQHCDQLSIFRGKCDLYLSESAWS